MKTEKFEVTGMTCASCVAHVEKSVSKLEGIKMVQVNLLTNSMTVSYDESSLDNSKIEKSVENAGYEAHLKSDVGVSTATTSKNVDIWFVGYTPYYTAGIWGGYDMNKVQTSTSFHKDIWRTIMEKVSSRQKIKNFQKPSSIVSASICTKCGKLAINGLCNNAEGGSCIKTEYFEMGTAPTEKCDCHIKCLICKTTNMLAGDNCPTADIITKIFLQKKETSKTADTPFILPENLAKTICTHGMPK